MAPTSKGKDDDKDDPIAQSLKIREKIGGLTAVLTAAEAKKHGIKMPEVKDQPKPSKPGKVVGAKPGEKVPNNKENDNNENKKVQSRPLSTRPSTSAATKTKKGEEDTADDPIAKSLQERNKAGGPTSVVDKKPAPGSKPLPKTPKNAPALKDEKKEPPVKKDSSVRPKKDFVKF